MPLVRRLDNDDKGRQRNVISIVQASPLQRGLDKLILGGDLPDPSVDDMLSIIRRMETIIEGLHDLHIPSCPTSTPPHPFCDPNSSDNTPNGTNSNHLSDEFNQTCNDGSSNPAQVGVQVVEKLSTPRQVNDVDCCVNTTQFDDDTMVRNVVADINAMAAEDSMGGDGSRTVVEPVLEDVEDTLNEEAVEGKREMGNDKSPHEPDLITNEDVTSPNAKCPRDVLVGPQFNLMQKDEEEHVILLGYTGVFEVPEVQDPIQPPHTDGGESPKNVMESTGPIQEGDVDMHLPTNVSSNVLTLYVVNYIFS
ncbi:unnamed protein product [Cochlearia groenlandica]